MAIDINDITVGSGTLTGTGTFDVLMQAVKAQLGEELAKNRITGDKYAEAYIAILNNTMNQAIQSTLTIEQKNLIIQQTKSEKAKILDTIDGVAVVGSIGKQKDVYSAQVSGFEFDQVSKAAKVFTDTWSVRRTTDEATAADGTNKLEDVNVGKLLQAMASKVNVTI